MKRKILIGVGILGVFAAGVAAVRLYQAAELARLRREPLEFRFDAAQVGRIEIGKGREESAVELVKQDWGWRVRTQADARADREKVERLLATLAGVKGEFRTKEKARFPDFAIDDESAFRIALSDASGARLLALRLGTRELGPASGFVRREDSKLVYFTPADWLTALGLYGAEAAPASDYWVSVALVDIPVDEVESIRVAALREGEEEVRSDVRWAEDPSNPGQKKWQSLRPGVPFEIDGEKVREFLTSMKTWKAMSARDPEAGDYGLENPAWRMTLGLRGGEEIELTASAENPQTKTYFIQISGEPVVFELPDYYFQNLDADDSRFFRANPLGVKPGRVTKLVIHTPETEFTFNPQEKPSEALAGYLGNLAGIFASRLLFAKSEAKKAKSPGRFWIEIEKVKRGQTPLERVILDVGELLSEERREYAARMRDSTQPFALPEYQFKRLFQNLDRLR